jgi:hypothetical protein
VQAGGMPAPGAAAVRDAAQAGSWPKELSMQDLPQALPSQRSGQPCGGLLDSVHESAHHVAAQQRPPAREGEAAGVVVRNSNLLQHTDGAAHTPGVERSLRYLEELEQSAEAASCSRWVLKQHMCDWPGACSPLWVAQWTKPWVL